MSDVSFSILRGKNNTGRLMERIRNQNYLLNKKSISDAALRGELSLLHGKLSNVALKNKKGVIVGSVRTPRELAKNIAEELKRIEVSDSRESEPSVSKKKVGRKSQGKSTAAQLRAAATYRARQKEIKNLVESLD